MLYTELMARATTTNDKPHRISQVVRELFGGPEGMTMERHHIAAALTNPNVMVWLVPNGDRRVLANQIIQQAWDSYVAMLNINDAAAKLHSGFSSAELDTSQELFIPEPDGDEEEHE